VTEGQTATAAASEEDELDASEPFEAEKTGEPTDDTPAGTEGLRRRPTPTFSPRIDDVMKTTPTTEPATTSSPRHAASTPEPSGSKPDMSKDEDRAPEGGRTLPTREPGTSFHETNELAATSASSQSSPTGIRNALDGFRQGRDIATQRDRGMEADDPADDEELPT
jgi:hypothetical protein